MHLTFFFSILLSFGTLCAASFQEKLAQKRDEVQRAIGEKKLHAIELATRNIEIYRITQIDAIEGIGKKTLIKLNKILGTRFHYEISFQVCYHEKIC